MFLYAFSKNIYLSLNKIWEFHSQMRSTWLHYKPLTSAGSGSTTFSSPSPSAQLSTGLPNCAFEAWKPVFWSNNESVTKAEDFETECESHILQKGTLKPKMVVNAPQITQLMLIPNPMCFSLCQEQWKTLRPILYWCCLIMLSLPWHTFKGKWTSFSGKVYSFHFRDVNQR